jgi:O-antigen/teichoic acid export membrane protein
MAIILGLIFIFSTPLVTTWLPAFSPGIPALKIFLLTSYFSSLVTFPANYIVTKEKQASLILFASIALIINVALNYIFLRLKFGINAVAWSTAISYFIYLIMVFVFGMAHFIGRKDMPGQIFRILIPALYISLVVLFLEKYIRYPQIWIRAFAQCGLFCLFAALLVALFERETGIIKVFLGMLKKKFAKT